MTFQMRPLPENVGSGCCYQSQPSKSASIKSFYVYFVKDYDPFVSFFLDRKSFSPNTAEPKNKSPHPPGRDRAPTKMSIYISIFLMILASLFPRPARAGESAVPGKFADAPSQALLVRNTSSADPFTVEVIALEKKAGRWRKVLASQEGVIGKNGFAPPGEKREGDSRTPSGTFPLGTVFGYAASFPTRMPYRQAGVDDLWIDDAAAPDYNRGGPRKTTQAASFERMRRDDDLYKLGIVVEYNTNPVIKGYGSAIFFHLWRGKGSATAGCIALAEEDLTKIVRWLDPAAQPVVMMGTNMTVEDMKE